MTLNQHSLPTEEASRERKKISERSASLPISFHVIKSVNFPIVQWLILWKIDHEAHKVHNWQWKRPIKDQYVRILITFNCNRAVRMNLKKLIPKDIKKETSKWREPLFWQIICIHLMTYGINKSLMAKLPVFWR